MIVPLPKEGISSHQSVVMPGKGIPRMDQANAGDHFVKIGIKIPKSLSRRQLELIRQFSVLEPPIENGLVSGTNFF